MFELYIGGGDRMPRRIMEFAQAVELTPQAMQRIGEAQRLRIYQRVAEKHSDVHGLAFHPYSTKGPYYYRPAGGRQAALRLRGKIGRGARSTAPLPVTRGGSLKFANYAAFKASLGRTGVDLMGPQGRMLRQMTTHRATAEQVGIGIAGEAAGRARGHQEGNSGKKLPRRAWLGASPDERTAIGEDLAREFQEALNRARSKGSSNRGV